MISTTGTEPCSSHSKSYNLEAESEIIRSSIGVHHMCVSNRTPARVPDSCLAQKSQFSPILDICATLSTMVPDQGNRKVLGWLSDDSHRHHITYLRKIAGSSSPQSLEDLITASSQFSKGQTTDGFLFSQFDRLRIAVNLSCSVFQFHGSWLKHHWRPRDIMFEPRSSTGIGDFYLPWSVEDNFDNSSPWSCPGAPTLIRNQTLFPLGLALVELSLCQNLGSIREPEDEDQNEAHANLKTANRLLSKVEECSGPEYADVVDRCLSWHDRRDTSLETEKMQEEMFQLVIWPLIENLRNFKDWLEMY
jgi:hypothetical protein